jgi:tRNA uridine 5-carboxymethylaminomethyl modification enzyme
MFTSRAEYRLSIRNDNADLRLMETGHLIGLISDKTYKKFELYRNALTDIYGGNAKNLPDNEDLSPWSIEKAKEEVYIHKKYEGYIEIQGKMANKMKKSKDRKIPEDFDYDKLESLSAETKQRLFEVRPRTIGQASGICAIKPSDIAILTVYLEKQKKRRETKEHGKTK